MEVKYYEKERLLLFKITEEIDEFEVKKIRRRADYEIERFSPKRVVFDFDNVTFMDSAGIGMVLGRYKMSSMFGGKMFMKNVSPNVKKVFEMAGVTRIIPIIEEQGGTEIGKCIWK